MVCHCFSECNLVTCYLVSYGVHHAQFVLQRRMQINIKKVNTHIYVYATTKGVLHINTWNRQNSVLAFLWTCRKNTKRNCLHKRVNLIQINSKLSGNSTCLKIKKYIYPLNTCKLERGEGRILPEKRIKWYSRVVCCVSSSSSPHPKWIHSPLMHFTLLSDTVHTA
jgi:hypothetical protein